MNILTLLEAAPGATQPGGSQLTFWIMIVLLFVVMWFFMIRPQRKQQKALEKFRQGLKKGDKVVTVGGIFGVVEQISENDPSVLIRVDKDVKIRVAKGSLVNDYSETAQN